jgi:signal transduction histidine kinase
MTDKSGQNPADGRTDGLAPVYKRHVQGAFVRSGASVFMWFCSWIAYYVDDMHSDNFIGISFSVLFLILFNLPTLWILKHISNKRLFEYFSILINILEIIGYTFIMHFVGGIEAAFLLPIYAALIAYVGVVASRKLPFIIAFFCAVSFSLMVTFEHLGILRSYALTPSVAIPWKRQIMVMLVTTGLMFVVAFISSYTADLLKKNRDRLRRQNEELKLALQKANESDRLKEALQRANESDRLKSEFLANMSHELRTPLNAIIGFSELLGYQYPEKLDESQNEFIKNINASGQHLLSIISDILDLSKIEAGKLHTELKDVHVPGLLNNGLAMFGEHARKQRVQLSVEVEVGLETIQADELRLKQIVYNLLSNAVKFTPDGGKVTLSARRLTRKNNQWLTKNGEIASLPVPAGREFIDHERVMDIAVTDAGIGVRKEDQQRIFNPFVQVDGSISRRYEGTGLGLSLTKRFAELHGGYICMESEGENKGSTFHCIIPTQAP